MSIKATNWVWSLTLGDATRKLVLLKYADHAHADGTNTWVQPATAAEFAECSERTVQRHMGWLRAEGYMREGDQNAYVWPASVPERYRQLKYQPIVYDLAMDEETRLLWKAEAAAGAAGGRRDKFARDGAIRRSRGDRLAPQNPGEDVQPVSSPVGRGDRLAPRNDDGGSEVTAGPVRGDTGGGSEVTAVSPKQPSGEPSGEPSGSDDSLRASAAASADDALDLGLPASSTSATPKRGRRTTKPPSEVSEEEQQLRLAVQALVGAYIDQVAAQGGTCTESQAGAIGKHCRRILTRDKVDPAVLLVAVQRAATRGGRAIDAVLAAPDGPRSMWERSDVTKQAMRRSWIEAAAKIEERQAGKRTAAGGAG